MLQVRPTSYRGRAGFLICGRDPLGRRVRIFAEERAAAEHIREKVARGEEIGVEDFEAREEARA